MVWENINKEDIVMPAKSKDQQRFFGMVHAYQKGELDTSNMSPAQKIRIQRVAKNMSHKAAKDYAETKHKGLPEKVATLLGSVVGAAAGSMTGASLMDAKSRKRHRQGEIVQPESYLSDVLKGAIAGATAGAGVGQVAGKALAHARKIQKLKTPRKETISLVKSHVSNQKMVVDEVRRHGAKHGLVAFPEISSYKPSSKVKMTTERAMRHYSGRKGLNPTDMTQEVLRDVYKQTYDKIWATDRKRAKLFTKAWKKPQFGGAGELNLEGFINARVAKRLGFSKTAEDFLTDEIIKYAAGKYEDIHYKSQIRSVSGKERVMSGVVSSGMPSALLTGALAMATGVSAKAAMKSAVGVGMLGTTIGAMAASAKQRVFVPTND